VAVPPEAKPTEPADVFLPGPPPVILNVAAGNLFGVSYACRIEV